MRSSIVTILFTLGSLAVAQNLGLGSLPKCGQDCFGNNFQGCEQFDYKCICGNKDLISELSCCVAQNCNSGDQNTIITLASGLCKAYGVDVPTQASCAASASSSGSASSTGASSAATAAGTTSTTAGAGTTSTTAGAGTTSTTAGAGTTSISASQSAAAQTSSTGSPGAAGPVATAGAGFGLAVGVLLAAAL